MRGPRYRTPSSRGRHPASRPVCCSRDGSSKTGSPGRERWKMRRIGSAPPPRDAGRRRPPKRRYLHFSSGIQTIAAFSYSLSPTKQLPAGSRNRALSIISPAPVRRLPREHCRRSRDCCSFSKTWPWRSGAQGRRAVSRPGSKADRSRRCPVPGRPSGYRYP